MRVSGNWIAVIISVMLALVLEFIRFPDLIANARPEWLTLVLVHWILRRPDIAGVGFGFVIGLALDVVSGSYFGIHTLALSLVSYLLVGMQKRVQLFPIPQQAFVVFFLVTLSLFIVYTFESLLSVPDNLISIFLQAFTSALIWPFFALLLDRISAWVR